MKFGMETLEEVACSIVSHTPVPRGPGAKVGAWADGDRVQLAYNGGLGSGDQGAKPPEAESFLALECPGEAAILPTSENSANLENDRYLLKYLQKL